MSISKEDLEQEIKRLADLYEVEEEEIEEDDELEDFTTEDWEIEKKSTLQELIIQIKNL